MGHTHAWREDWPWRLLVGKGARSWASRGEMGSEVLCMTERQKDKDRKTETDRCTESDKDEKQGRQD